MSSSADSLPGKSAHSYTRDTHTVVHQGELLRHPLHVRIVHWSVALSFVLSLLSGLAIYSPWTFKFLAPLFGGGAMTRLLHPWFALAFVVAFAFELAQWFAPMSWAPGDTDWIRHMKEYVSNKQPVERETVGFFNAGQKLFFWTILGCIVIFVITGFIMWLPEIFGRALVPISYVLHDIAGLTMLVSFIVHLYEGLAQQPGTLRAMARGTVTRKWAWTHHPGWYREATGRDPKEDYEAAVKRAGTTEATSLENSAK
jgi:formate dehydrogenase subunit gamma